MLIFVQLKALLCVSLGDDYEVCIIFLRYSASMLIPKETSFLSCLTMDWNKARSLTALQYICSKYKDSKGTAVISAASIWEWDNSQLGIHASVFHFSALVSIVVRMSLYSVYVIFTFSCCQFFPLIIKHVLLHWWILMNIFWSQIWFLSAVVTE